MESAGGFFARLALYWDWFQFAWSEWVINYDFAHQIDTRAERCRNRRAAGAIARSSYYQREAGARPCELLLRARPPHRSSPYFLPGVLVFLIALLIFLRGRSMIRYAVARWTLRARRGGDLTASLAVFEYREMLHAARKTGWKKVAIADAARIRGRHSRRRFSAPVAQLTELYQSARFGNHPARVDQMSSLLRSIRDRSRIRKPARQEVIAIPVVPARPARGHVGCSSMQLIRCNGAAC